MSRRSAGAWLVAASLASCPSSMRSASDTYRLDPANSRVNIHVGKAGALSFVAGHTHDVSGPVESGSIEFDPDDPSRSRVLIDIAASKLRVAPEGEPPEDVPKVQEAMESDKVLNVARYQHIRFESTGVTVKARGSAALDLVLSGQLTIRGVVRPVTVPVHVALSNSGLTATGRCSIKQTAFGITPISVGGVVAVKDALDIGFSIAARR